MLWHWKQCISITWILFKSADFDSVGFVWGLSFYIFIKPQGEICMLVQSPWVAKFEKSCIDSSAAAAAAAAKSLQSCLTLCDPIDGSPPGSPIPGILQARTLEWVAISFSNAWKQKVKVKPLSRVWLFATPRTAAYQAPPSMGFSRQDYWNGVPLPSANKVKIFN